MSIRDIAGEKAIYSTSLFVFYLKLKNEINSYIVSRDSTSPKSQLNKLKGLRGLLATAIKLTGVTYTELGRMYGFTPGTIQQMVEAGCGVIRERGKEVGNVERLFVLLKDPTVISLAFTLDDTVKIEHNEHIEMYKELTSMINEEIKIHKKKQPTKDELLERIKAYHESLVSTVEHGLKTYKSKSELVIFRRTVFRARFVFVGYCRMTGSTLLYLSQGFDLTTARMHQLAKLAGIILRNPSCKICDSDHFTKLYTNKKIKTKKQVTLEEIKEEEKWVNETLTKISSLYDN